jgi:hypothetical protein
MIDEKLAKTPKPVHAASLLHQPKKIINQRMTSFVSSFEAAHDSELNESNFASVALHQVLTIETRGVVTSRRIDFRIRQL